MPVNDIKFKKGQGGLGRPLPGEDYISGLVFYTDSLPSGFTSTSREAQVFQIEDAEALGITDTYSDETKATASYLVTGVGSNGDTLELKVVEYEKTVSLYTYEKVSGDTTAANIATAIAAGINASTYIHGYTASVSTATVTITARPGLGVFLNSGSPLVASVTGTIAGTVTQFTGGVASKLANFHYHISEFFRIMNTVGGQGNLYIGLYAVPSGSPTFTEVQTLQNFALGKIRQFGVYGDFATYSSSHIQALQSIASTVGTNHKPCSILYGGDISGTTNLSSLTNLSGLNSEKVSLVIGQDGEALGARLFRIYGKSITTLGALLGAVAASKVSENIAWTGKFNISDGTELETPAFANGTLYKSISSGLETQLFNYRYIFIKNFVGFEGTYFNDSFTCTAATSDYGFIENNRTIDKMIRNIRIKLLPDLNSPLELNSNGTLADSTIEHFRGLCAQVIEQMQRDTELSGQDANAEDFVFIDPNQNVLSTSTLEITVSGIPFGVARNIIVTVGYTTKI